jgi:hypothetical protein
MAEKRGDSFMQGFLLKKLSAKTSGFRENSANFSLVPGTLALPYLIF